MTETTKDMRKQLLTLTKKIDKEGLAFLLEQANIIVYNKEVDKINKSIEKESSRKTSTKDVVEIKQVDEFSVEAEADKSSFIFIIRGKRKFITRNEMREIVKIAHQNNSLYLYKYLLRERSDIIKDCFINSKNDKIIENMIHFLTKNYKTK